MTALNSWSNSEAKRLFQFVDALDILCAVPCAHALVKQKNAVNGWLKTNGFYFDILIPAVEWLFCEEMKRDTVPVSSPWTSYFWLFRRTTQNTLFNRQQSNDAFRFWSR